MLRMRRHKRMPRRAPCCDCHTLMRFITLRALLLLFRHADAALFTRASVQAPSYNMPRYLRRLRCAFMPAVAAAAITPLLRYALYRYAAASHAAAAYARHAHALPRYAFATLPPLLPPRLLLFD